MKPIQSDTNQKGCDPISSNCVIWQGPDIPCIDLCKGDSISDVTAKLAQQLCDIVTQLDIASFDLSCFNPVCPSPQNFHDLIQFLIDEICKIENCVFVPCTDGCVGKTCRETSSGTEGCPDCVVDIAPCFYYQNQLGDTITTMQLTDYVHAIGNRICDIASQISIIQQTLTDHETRITALEDCCEAPIDSSRISGPLIPNFTSSCLATSIPTEGIPIETVVATLEQAFCELRAATGLPADIFNAILKQCVNLDLSPSLALPGVAMSGLPGWITQANYTTQAASINNMWLTICDIRAAVANIMATCCPKGCDELIIDMVVTISGDTLTFFFTGSAPAGFQDCSPLGNQVTITDVYGGLYIVMVPVIPYLNGAGYTVDLGSTPINTSSNLNIEMNGCWENLATNTRCERCMTYSLINQENCPELTLSEGQTTIGWNFNNTISTAVTYTVELWNAAGDTLVASQSSVNPGVGLVSGTFSSLDFGTTYKIRLGITVSGETTYCPFGTTTTLPDPCPSATDVSAIGTI